MSDSHGTMLNLPQGRLDQRVRVVRVFGMMGTLDQGFDATMFVGYRAAGHDGGIPNHRRVGPVRGGWNDPPARHTGADGVSEGDP